MTNQQDVHLPSGIVAVRVNNQQAKVLAGRIAFVEKYCSDRGWDMLNITVEQFLEIRKQPGWKNPVKAG